MGRFSNDFKIKKGYTFNLEGDKDPLINKSEGDLLEEAANLSNCSVSKLVRDFVLDGLIRHEHLYSKNPILDQFITDNNNSVLPSGDGDPPSILDDWKTWKAYFENCDKETFFKVFKAFTERRNQQFAIMNEKDLQLDESRVKYKVDFNATSRSVPMGSGY